MPTQDSSDTPGEVTLELTKGQSINVAPHNTQLVEFTGSNSSRNHFYFYTVTDQIEVQDFYLFQTIDPESYADMRQHVMFNLAYKVALSDVVDQSEEDAYQQQINARVAAWSELIPDYAIDLLIATSD